jgi:hypothetical protein
MVNATATSMRLKGRKGAGLVSRREARFPVTGKGSDSDSQMAAFARALGVGRAKEPLAKLLILLCFCREAVFCSAYLHGKAFQRIELELKRGNACMTAGARLWGRSICQNDNTLVIKGVEHLCVLAS